MKNGVETAIYPRRKTYCPVKLSIFLVLCNKTSWGSIATASRYRENVHITCPTTLLDIEEKIWWKERKKWATTTSNDDTKEHTTTLNRP